MPGEEVEIIKPFGDYAGLFLCHCHNLEYEDMGMMRNCTWVEFALSFTRQFRYRHTHKISRYQSVQVARSLDAYPQRSAVP